MTRAQQLRLSSNTPRGRRTSAAHSPQGRSAPARRPLGIPEIDGMLGGGLPVGGLVELVGPLSSSRSLCAQAFAARVLAEGNVAAWIDASESSDASYSPDPESAAADGLDLSGLLWVRCADLPLAPIAPQPPLPLAPRPAAFRNEITPTPSAANVILHLSGCGSPHPRGTGPDLAPAPTQPLSSIPHPSGPIPVPPRPHPSFGQAPRSAAIPPLRSERQLAFRSLLSKMRQTQLKQAQPGQFRSSSLQSITANSSFLPSRSSAAHWKAVSQALRAADLILSAGGCASLVLDLGSLPPEAVNLIPLASWYRLRAAAARSRCTVLLLTQHPCAQSSAEVILRTHTHLPKAGSGLAALPFSVELVRQRLPPCAAPAPIVFAPRKPPQPVSAAQWHAPAMWTRRELRHGHL